MDQGPPLDDQNIIPDYLSGDANAVGIVDGWVNVVLRTEFRALHSDWEDLRQEVRLRLLACLRANRFNGDSTLRTFVHRVTLNVGIDHARRIDRRRESTVSGEIPMLTAEGGEDAAARLAARDLLGRILEGSSGRDRMVVDLVFLQHLSYTEAAKRLGISDGAFRVLVFRCRKRLLRRLRKVQRRGALRW